MSRLPNQPGELINRLNVIRFTFDGKPVEAYEGDTVGSALYAAGRRTFSRSFKYHRRRGLLCCAGQCPNCIVAVDGAPGVRACTEPVREGMKVEHLNAQPGLELDVMRATDLVGRSSPRPASTTRRSSAPASCGRCTRRSSGTPPASACCASSSPSASGAPSTAGATRTCWSSAAERPAPAAAADAAARARTSCWSTRGRVPIEPIAGVEILARASALGYFDGMVPVWQGDTLHQIRARRHVFATGAIEQPLVFARNDLPGVMLSGGALRLTELYAVSPGARAVVATTSDRGLEAAAKLADAGVQIVAVADLRTERTAAARRSPSAASRC